MNNVWKVAVIFNGDLFDESRIKSRDVLYSGVPNKKSEKNKIDLIEELRARAAKENIEFKKRALSRSFISIFHGFIVFSEELKLDDTALIDFVSLFCNALNKSLGVSVVDYSLVNSKDISLPKESRMSKFFYLELFNYNFLEHRAIKTEFARPQILKRVNELAEAVFTEYKLKSRDKADRTVTVKSGDYHAGNSANKAVKADKAVKTVKTGKAVNAVKAVKAASPVKEAKQDKAKAGKNGKSGNIEQKNRSIIIKETEKRAAQDSEPAKSGIEPASAEPRTDIGEQVSLISMSWSMLTPPASHPVLEPGAPSEITGSSRVRIYFQKPGIRQIVWRFLGEPAVNSERPILRVYVDDKMLWYEILDSREGSKYIIFPDDYELYRTWVEIGYTGENGEFTFIARSPLWPPACLFKKLPLNTEKIVRNKRLPLIGATEGTRGGERLPADIFGSGSGFFGSSPVK